MTITRLLAASTLFGAPLALLLGCNGEGGRHAVPYQQTGAVTSTGGAAGGGGGVDGLAGSGAGGAGSSASGAGGNAPGGDGGSGGAGGAGMSDAGNANAGAAGLAGGGAGGTGATSGAGGSGGADGGFGGWAGMPAPVATCGERCNADADCRVFSMDQGFHCNAAHRCDRFAEPCRSSEECIPDASFWVFACDSDDDCFFFSDDLCVNVGGVGRCARAAPSPDGCDASNPDEITLPRFGASGTALVCATASRTCVSGACVPGCQSNTDCSPSRNGTVCDTQAGVCRCVRDSDCGGAGVSHCNTMTGLCECTNERDCEEVPNANACLGGRCGCSGVTACNDERRFSGTTFVCE